MSARHHGGPTLPRCDFEQNLPAPKLSFSICCTRWLAWILQSPIWDTWLHGRIQQGTRTGDFGAQYPVCPLGPRGASSPPSQEPGSPAPARRSPCSGSSCTAWLGPSHGFTSAPRTPRPLPALPTPPLPDRPMAQARGGRAVRWDAQSRLRKEGRAPSDRWRGAKTLLLLAVPGVAETRRPTSGGMGCLCYCPFVHS